MATLPTPTQIAGKYVDIYDAYFNEVSKNGNIPAQEAAKFLKKSGLSDVVLSKIWDISDPNCKGFLDKNGFFVALKLLSVVQMGKDASINNINLDVPPPKISGSNVKILNSNKPPVPVQPSQPLSDWAMKPMEKLKYEQLFESLQPVNGYIPGNKVKGLLIDSKLPTHTLGKIWDLADMDKDGSLDRHEFIVAMHLVYKALEKYTIPSSLPVELLPPKLPQKRSSVSSIVTPTLTPTKNETIPMQPVINWVITKDEKNQFDRMFQMADVDKDGFVSGNEIKDVFLKSGIAQPILANIWGLCDIKQCGKLNSEQFALAMWFIHRKLKGIDPPQELSSEMIPPSFRSKNILNSNNVTTYSNNEIEMIIKDIENLTYERQLLESEISQNEADLKIKSGETHSLQGELNTLVATYKQLENQRGEAHKRLNDLKNQVEKLKNQSNEQESIVNAQEQELKSKKQELEELKIEESNLEKQQKNLSDKFDHLCETLQESELTLTQMKTSIEDVREYQINLKNSIAILDSCLNSGETSSVAHKYLIIEPDYQSALYEKLITVEEVEIDNQVYEEKKQDHFNTETENDNIITNAVNDPFTSNDQFSSAFTTNTTTLFESDPFGGFQPTPAKTDPFDPFGASKTDDRSSDMGGRDPFGCEPFGTTPVGKSKKPPPRPAPPRPVQPTSRGPSPAPDSFADFSSLKK